MVFASMCNQTYRMVYIQESVYTNTPTHVPTSLHHTKFHFKKTSKMGVKLLNPTGMFICKPGRSMIWREYNPGNSVPITFIVQSLFGCLSD